MNRRAFLKLLPGLLPAVLLSLPTMLDATDGDIHAELDAVLPTPHDRNWGEKLTAAFHLLAERIEK